MTSSLSRRIGFFAPIGLVHWALVGRFWFVCDDAFISFRYARNWVEGHGLRYNLGDHTPVEGYSNFLWVVVSAVAEWFHANITLVPILVSVACGTLLLYLVFDNLLRRCPVSLPVAWLATLSQAGGWPGAEDSSSFFAAVFCSDRGKTQA